MMDELQSHDALIKKFSAQRTDVFKTVEGKIVHYFLQYMIIFY